MSYYRDEARAYAASTQDVDMAALYARFVPLVPPGGRVLDAGCGSGRDARAFRALGFEVDAFDASPELAAIASAHAGMDVQVADFLSLTLAPGAYDAIWACASLLHVPEAEQADAWGRLWHGLKPGGVVYASYKLGDDTRPAERTDSLGRPFTDGTEARLHGWLKGLTGLARVDAWVTRDAAHREDVAWLNVLAYRCPNTVQAAGA